MEFINQKHILVAGKGFIGLAAAFRFVKAGYKVTVVAPEQDEYSASTVAMGVSAIKGQTVARDPLYKAKVVGHENLPRWVRLLEKESGRTIAHNFSGVAETYLDSHEADKIISRVFGGKHIGVGSPLKIEGADFKNRWQPADICSEDLAGAFFYEQDGYVHPIELIETLEWILKSNGVKFVNDQVVQVLPKDKSNLQINLKNQIMHADEILLACGAGTNSVMKSSGLFVLNLYREFGQTLVSPSIAGIKGAGKMTKFSYLFSQRDFRVGASSISEKNWNLATRSDEIEKLKELTASAFARSRGFVDELGLEEHWGVRVKLKDRMPVVGEVRFSGSGSRVLIATGLHKTGMQLADPIAQYLVSLVSHVSHPFDFIDNFNADRFLKP